MKEIGNSMVNLESGEILAGMSNEQLKDVFQSLEENEVICFQEDVGIPNCQFINWGVAEKDELLPKGWEKHQRR